MSTEKMTDEAPIYSGCRINGNVNTYMYWTNDTDLMVKVDVSMTWPPKDGHRIISAATRLDIDDRPWQPIELTDEQRKGPARALATTLIRAARNN